MFRRSAHRLAACTPMLQAIIRGTASSGWKIRSRMAPATAEKAKPESPETKAPANTATLSRRLVAMSGTMRPFGSIVVRLRHGDLDGAGAKHGLAPAHLHRRDRLRVGPFQHGKPDQ